MEIQAVAAVVVGGASQFGGRGNVFPGTLSDVLLLIVIKNGLGTRGVSQFVYAFVDGALISLAINLDAKRNRAPPMSLGQMFGAARVRNANLTGPGRVQSARNGAGGRE